MGIPFEPSHPSSNGTGPTPAQPGKQAPSPQPPERRIRVGRTLLYLLVAALAIPVLAFVIARLTGTGPFAEVHLFPVTLHNDTAITVVVRRCATTCTAKDQAVTLMPGQVVQVGLSDGAVLTPYYLHDAAGALVSCLPLQANSVATGLTVQISRAETCPGTPVTLP